MAITQVRVKLGEEWTQLAYNEATGRWEGELAAPGTSVHQPGGYFPLTAECSNESGQTDTLSGEQYPGLRLVVRETIAPVLTIVSPLPGYLTTGKPVFTVEATDEEGGSGVDPNSFDPPADSRAEIPGGFRFTWSPASWEEGSHTVTFSVRDYDGNESTISGAYLVDTVPPELALTLPDIHRVVDWTEVTLAGQVQDSTSGVERVSVSSGGQEWVVASIPSDGGLLWSATGPLEVGENHITVTATDKAGLQTSETVWMLRLITDRSQGDVDRVTQLLARNLPWDMWTPEEQAFWQGVVRGAYNADDMNRVGIAVDYLTRELTRRGYAPVTQPKTNWTESDAPTVSSLSTYLKNVVQIREQLPVHAPDVPPDMDGFTFQEANDIEINLVETDRFFPLMEKSAIYSGEAFSGEF